MIVFFLCNLLRSTSSMLSFETFHLAQSPLHRSIRGLRRFRSEDSGLDPFSLSYIFKLAEYGDDEQVQRPTW